MDVRITQRPLKGAIEVGRSIATFEYEGELLCGTTRQMRHNASLNMGTTHSNNQEREEVISDRNFCAVVNRGPVTNT